MLSLVDLPEEILIMVIKNLDTVSIYKLYQTCGIFKNVLLMSGVVRSCNLSCNTLSTSKSLELELTKGIFGHLYELNLCGVSNLRKTALLPALKRMKCLKTLDVSFTEINVFDMLELYPYCSTIKNLTINFTDCEKFEGKILIQCQEVFKNFINVHFVLDTRFLNSPLQVLKKASLDTVKFTICDAGGRPEEDEIETICTFKHLCLFIVNRDHLNAPRGTWNAYVPLVKMENVEYIILEYNDTYSICVSSLFHNFFSENFKITSHFTFDKNKYFYGTVAIMIWNKESTTFDEHFFSTLKRRLKKIIACEITVSNEQSLPSNDYILNYDWVHLRQMETDENIRNNTEPNFKKMRVVKTEQVLDYDNIFSEHKNIQLSVYFPDPVIATLSSRSIYLSKLTYLSLTGSFVRYSNEFFNVLFRSCNVLTTLNVEATKLSPCTSAIARSIPLTQSVRNIRLVDKRIDFKTLFSAFTQCRTIENIFIIDISIEQNDLADLAALYQCANLYSLCIHARLTKATWARLNSIHKTLLKKNPEHFVNLSFKHNHHASHSHYHPHTDVFKLDPIKPV